MKQIVLQMMTMGFVTIIIDEKCLANLSQWRVSHEILHEPSLNPDSNEYVIFSNALVGWVQ